MTCYNLLQTIHSSKKCQLALTATSIAGLVINIAAATFFTYASYRSIKDSPPPPQNGLEAKLDLPDCAGPERYGYVTVGIGEDMRKDPDYKVKVEIETPAGIAEIEETSTDGIRLWEKYTLKAKIGMQEPGEYALRVEVESTSGTYHFEKNATLEACTPSPTAPQPQHTSQTA